MSKSFNNLLHSAGFFPLVFFIISVSLWILFINKVYSDKLPNDSINVGRAKHKIANFKKNDQFINKPIISASQKYMPNISTSSTRNKSVIDNTDYYNQVGMTLKINKAGLLQKKIYQLMTEQTDQTTSNYVETLKGISIN